MSKTSRSTTKKPVAATAKTSTKSSTVAAAPATPPAAPTPAPKPVVEAAAPVASLRSELHLSVHPEMLAFAQELARTEGAHELVFTTDGWKTVRVLRSSETPRAFAPQRLILDGVSPGTEVEFALHLRPAAATRGLWLNNGGRNFRQQSR